MARLVSLVAAVALVAGAAQAAPEALQPAPVSPLAAFKADRTVPRTRDGHPDLQGVVWDAYFLAPLQVTQSKPAPSLVLSEDQARKAYAALVNSLLNSPLLKPILAFDPEYEGILHNSKGLPIVRGARRSRLLVLPADGKLPLTPEGARQGQLPATAIMKSKADNPEDRNSLERCTSMGGTPPISFLGAPIPREFVQTRDHMVMHSETGDEVRVIPFATAHESREKQPAFGDSIARWEGDTLVIETTNLPRSQRLRFSPTGILIVNPDATVIERFTRLSRDELLYQFTVLDPKVYAGPWLAEYSFFRANYRMFPGNCHEGNYGLPNILAGAREEERAAAAAMASSAPSL